MAASVPTAPPSCFVAGDTVEFTQVIAGYSPADGWELSVRLITSPAIAATVTDDGAQTYTVTFAAEKTDAITSATTARLFGRVSLPSGYAGSAGVAGEGHTVIDQYVTVLPNLGTATVDTLLTDAARALAKAKAQLARLLDSPIESYSVGSRAATYRKIAEVRAEIATWQHQVWLEQNPTKAMPSLQMVFSAPR